MKYNTEVTINAPLDKVIDLFCDPNHIDKWQPGFISIEHISGTIGEEGAKSRLRYQMGKREIEMIETITRKNLPHEFSGTYEAKGVWNEVKNHFEPVTENQTRYWAENEFKMSGFMRIIAFFMPGAFKKQSQKYMDLFKKFVEETA